MDLSKGSDGPGQAAEAREDSAAPANGPASAVTVQEATARMFRSVRAGRSWLRNREAPAAALPPACVSMKPGNDEPALFMIPGAPGSVFQLGPLAAALPSPMPVYAIKPRGLGDGLTPCTTIAEMAEYAIGVARAVRPEGPYLLMGYSAGGLVALEMARKLTAGGQEVPAVVLLDTYPGKPHWPFLTHAEIIVHQTRSALRSLRRCGLAQVMHEIARRTRSLLDYLAASGIKFLPPPPVEPEGWSEESRRVYSATYDAGEAYRPARYNGRVIFVRPEEVEDLTPQSPTRAWRKILTGIEVRVVPGSHLNMVEENSAATAAAIGDCLDQVMVARTASRDSPDRRRTTAPDAIEPRMECPSCP